MALINPTEIRNYCPEFPANVAVDDAKALTYIAEAELSDLRQLLQVEFYTHILTNLTDTEIATLLNGGDYEYSGKTYPNPGVKEVLARYSFARYVFFGSTTQSSYGGIVKQNDNAREATYQEKKDRYNTNRQIAFEQWTLVYDFLCRKSSDYPLWVNQSKKPRKRKFSVIKK